MCLAVAAEVINVIDEYNADVEVQGVAMKISTMLVPKLQAGDYVLVHAGFAIEKIDQIAAEENLRIWRELQDIVDSEDDMIRS